MVGALGDAPGAVPLSQIERKTGHVIAPPSFCVARHAHKAAAMCFSAISTKCVATVGTPRPRRI